MKAGDYVLVDRDPAPFLAIVVKVIPTRRHRRAPVPDWPGQWVRVQMEDGHFTDCYPGELTIVKVAV